MDIQIAMDGVLSTGSNFAYQNPSVIVSKVTDLQALHRERAGSKSVCLPPLYVLDQKLH